MVENSKTPHLKHRESLTETLSVGFFFVLIGMIFVVTPNLASNVQDFFRNFDIVGIPNIDASLPAPKSPANHLEVYSAAAYVGLVYGVFQIAILALRFALHSPLDKKAETASNIVFWLGAYYLNTTFLNESLTLAIWFEFWAQIVMLLGVSLVVRAGILASRRM